MTGIYVRALVDGRYESIEIDELSDEALDEFISRMSFEKDDGWNWVKVLVKWIRDNVKPEPSGYSVSEN